MCLTSCDNKYVVIIVARSAVFRAMFQHDMQECIHVSHCIMYLAVSYKCSTEVLSEAFISMWTLGLGPIVFEVCWPQPSFAKNLLES